MNNSSETILTSPKSLLGKIYVIRKQKVMLDADLASLYGIENKQLKRQVRRNISRFPDDFMFELTQKEVMNLRCQFGTSSLNTKDTQWGGTRYTPMCFTEYGVLMLSSVLSSEKATQINIQIMRVFSKIRQELLDHSDLKLSIEKLEQKTDQNTQQLEYVFQYLQEAEKPKKVVPRKKIGYKTPKT